MSENILIGKSRKSGKWEILTEPGRSFDVHLKAYQKFAASSPVNDEYSQIRLGRVQNTSTPLTLITTEENKRRLDSLRQSTALATDVAKAAAERQKAIDKEKSDAVAEHHAEELALKNAIIDSVRKSSGQPEIVAPPAPKPQPEEPKK